MPAPLIAPADSLRVGDAVVILHSVYAGRTDRVSRIEQRPDYNAYFLEGIQGGRYAFTSWDLSPKNGSPNSSALNPLTPLTPARTKITRGLAARAPRSPRLPANPQYKPCRRCGGICQSRVSGLCRACGVIVRRQEREMEKGRAASHAS